MVRMNSNSAIGCYLFQKYIFSLTLKEVVLLGVGGRMVFCYKKGHEMGLAVKNKVGSLLTVGKVVCNFSFVCPHYIHYWKTNELNN